MLTISVCIPAIEAHLPFLERCIESIYEQICLPNEVIISLSNIKSDLESVKLDVEHKLKKYIDSLSVRVIYTKDKQYAGQNRNIAVKYAKGDIISFIDIDDIMYPHRIYTIKKIFSSQPDCIGMLHYFSENQKINPVWNYNTNNLKKYEYSDKIHYGHPSFKRRIFDEFVYPDTPRMQDFEFIKNILPKYIDNLYIYTQQLTCYNSNDSTYYNPEIAASV